MAVRIKDGMIPYTGGTGIEITNNHVINVLLRAMNNLIHVNDERELYVDLQLDDGIEPTDDFPVGVTTGKVLEEDGWQSNGIILNWKTTSGDYVRLIYGTDGKLYYDPGTGEWIEIASGDTVEELEANINTKTFWLESTSDTTTAQAILDWYLDEKNPLIINGNKSFIMTYYGSSSIVFRSHLTIANTNSYHRVTAEQITITYADGEVTDVNKVTTELGKFLSTDSDYGVIYIPQYDGSPATKKYVDDTASGKISDTAYGPGWGGQTTTAPSQKAVKTAVDAKQDALSTQTAYTTKGTATKVPTITTNTLGQVTAITETNISFPVTSVNGQTGAVTVSEFKANNGGVKIFDMPTVNSSMDSIIQWFTGGGNILLREITSNVEYYYFVSNWDGPGRTISVKNITGTTVTVKGIAYDASGICTNIVVNNQYLLPSGGTNGQIIMMVSGTPTWVNPADVGFKLQASDTEIDVPYVWSGTEAQYQARQSYSEDTEYHTV